MSKHGWIALGLGIFFSLVIAQYTTQALVRDKVDMIQGAITSSARETMRPIVQRFKGLCSYNMLYEGGVCDRRHICPGLVPSQQLDPLVEYVIRERKLKKGYIVAADYNYGHNTSKWLQKYIRDKGGEDMAVEFFPLDVTNFSAVISRISVPTLGSFFVSQAFINVIVGGHLPITGTR